MRVFVLSTSSYRDSSIDSNVIKSHNFLYPIRTRLINASSECYFMCCICLYYSAMRTSIIYQQLNNATDRTRYSFIADVGQVLISVAVQSDLAFWPLPSVPFPSCCKLNFFFLCVFFLFYKLFCNSICIFPYPYQPFHISIFFLSHS